MEHGLAGIYLREEIQKVNPMWVPFDIAVGQINPVQF